MTAAPPERPRAPVTPLLELLAILALTLGVPFGVRLAQGSNAEPPRLPYLPALEGRREAPFHAHRIAELQRLNPGYVVIGDSMAGTRIDERLLGSLAGQPVAPLLQAGSGPAFWYLAMKNWVIASGIRPKVVFVFFRDTNLTDTMFRLDEDFGWSLDPVATDRVEEELDSIVSAAIRGRWSSVHRSLDRLYRPDPARRRLEPALTRAPASWIWSSRRRQASLLEQANARFGVDRLRVMEASDMPADPGTDFHAAVNRSVLPLMIRDAAGARFQLCLVRVQRRPAGSQPPAQPAALRQYIADLRRYVESRGAILHDDTGHPAITLDMYEDGDHVARHARDRYTRLFYERLEPLFEPLEDAR